MAIGRFTTNPPAIRNAINSDPTRAFGAQRHRQLPIAATFGTLKVLGKPWVLLPTSAWQASRLGSVPRIMSVRDRA
ncbi:hypothetical protein FB565_008351 [Actinoplanes lutulentus]|nr:hypothetical protein [Actinoplanes lutulentus]